MLNLNERKKIIIFILLLILVISSLLFVRGNSKKEYLKSDNYNNPINSIENDIILPEDRNSIITNFDYEIKKLSTKNIVIPDKIVLDFTNYYQIEIGNNFTIPPIPDTSYPYIVKITYYFRSKNSNNFEPISDLYLNELGTYKVHYKVVDIYNRITEKDIFIDVVDTINPTIEGYIEEYDSTTNLTSYIPIGSNSITNKSIKISFSDNYKVTYAEYYKAIYETINNTNTIEKDSLMNVIPIDLNNDFIITEDGEYHIRSYDSTGNYSEYIVTVDKTKPTISLNYEVLDTNQVLVNIISNEPIQELPGFNLSTDKKVLSKVYDTNMIENINIKDLAGNIENTTITVNQIIEVSVLQNNIKTNSRQLHLEDGYIQLKINGLDTYTITYYLNGNNYLYTNNYLTEPGTYYFTITSNTRVIKLTIDITDNTTSD